MSVNTGRAAPARPSRGLLVLGGALLLVGLPPTLALLGVPWLAWLEPPWRDAWGLFALPMALTLAGAGGYLLFRRARDPWRLPWARIVALEAMLFAALTLLALAAGEESARQGGLGGRIGWALAELTQEAVGPVFSVLLWLAAGVIGTLVALRLGARPLVDWLEALAADEPLPRGAPQRGDRDAHPDPHPDPYADPYAAPPPVARTAAGRDAAREPAPSAAARRAEPAPAARTEAGGVRKPAAAPAAKASPSADERAGDKAAAMGGAAAATTRGPRKPPKVTTVGGRPSQAARARRSAQLPELALLGEEDGAETDAEALRALATRIEETLDSFGVPVEVVEIEHGPTVTRFGLVPGTVERAGETRRIKVARITALKDDLALALSVPTIRIEAPVPGRSLVGVEIPNPESVSVGLRRLLQDRAFRKVAQRDGLALALGRAVSGAPAVADLGRMPHLLVAGATGSGKSVCLGTIIASLLFQNTPDALRLVLIDPKRVEMSRYRKLPHLVADVVTDVREVVGALRWVAAEMDRRYRAFSELGARDLKAYNRRLPSGTPPLPKIVVVIDELADLMMTAPEDVEPLLTRLAQLARATSIHLVIATQRPSTDVITGLIKANVPARIAFAVSSGTDSRVILDTPGAETLLGRGDMLFQPPDAAKPVRLQGAMVRDEELDRLVAFWRDAPWDAPPRLPPWDDLVPAESPEEELYERAVEVALGEPRVSPSLLQRRLRVGYHKARELYDRMRREGVLERRPEESEDDAYYGEGGPGLDAPGGPLDGRTHAPWDKDADTDDATDDATDDDEAAAAETGDDLSWVDDEFGEG